MHVTVTTQVPVRLYAADAASPKKHTSSKVVNDVCVITLDTPNAKVQFWNMYLTP